MGAAFAAHHHGGGSGALPQLLLGVVAAGYVMLAARCRQDGRGWSSWRTSSFLAGCGLLALGLTPGLLPYPGGDFREHMLQHLLIGMLAPLGLVLAAPVTLFLRSLPPAAGRRVGRMLHSRPLRIVANPITALALTTGGLAVLYLTPLYAETTVRPVLHDVVHLHFLAAGYLFSWVIAGPDPAPRRPSVPARLVVLGVAVAFHAVLAQLMYAGLVIDLPVPPDQRRGAAELMYYGGDIAELLLAFALVSTWHRHRPRQRGAAGVRNCGTFSRTNASDPAGREPDEERPAHADRSGERAPRPTPR
jgi:putative membrane protein